MSDLESQYLILEDLRKVENKVSRLKDLVEKIPEKIEVLRTKLEKRKAVFTNLKSSVEDTEKKLRQFESDLKDKEEKLRKSEGKLMDVTTNDEYKAAQREIEAQKAAKGAFEEEVLNLLTGLDDRRKELKSQEETFKSDETVILNEIKQLEEDLRSLETELSQENEKRTEASKQLQADIASLYRRLVPRIDRNAITVIEAGICTGCHLKVRPQIYNEILGFRAVHCCGNCGRILIPSKVEPAGESSPQTTH